MQPGDLGLFVRAISFSTTGSANARVLPDPVLARPIRSRPVAEAHAGRVRIEKKGEDYAFRRRFNEKPGVIPDYPGQVRDIS